MNGNGDLAARAAEFERHGYTIFRGFNAAWVQPWRELFEERYRRELGEAQRSAGVGQPRAVLRGLLQERPDLFLPSLVDPAMLDFLEELMGPCVGFDSLQVAVTPPVSEAEARTVRAWHRDMWALPGWSDDYLPPNAVNVLTYLQEGPEFGHLLVLPGSHRGRRLVGAGGTGALQPGERAVELAAGDTVVVHSSLLHSTSGNYSGRLRIFASYFYTRCWLPKRDAYGMQSMQREIRAARARGDRRLARLFEPDRELLARRASGDRGEHTERELWRQWRQEERAERERGAARAAPGARERAIGRGATRDAAGPRAAPAAEEATPCAAAGPAAAAPGEAPPATGAGEPGAGTGLSGNAGHQASAVEDATPRADTGLSAAAPGEVPATTAPARTDGATTAGIHAGSGDRAAGPTSTPAGGRPPPDAPARTAATPSVAPKLELVLDARAELGEGPAWHAATGTLYWVDLFAGIVHHYQPATGLAGRVDVGEFVGCVVPRERGGLLAATASGIYHLDPASGVRTRVSDIEADRPETHFNDGKVDPAGRFWFGSIAIDRTTATLGDLYSLEPDLTVTRRRSGIDNTNGMDWSPDGRTMYYIDSLTRQVTAFDYDPASGDIANPRPAVTLPEDSGVPDGMTVALDGTLWVAHWGGARVTRWHPTTGTLIQTIPVPANLTTSCAFAGPALDELYITTARYQENGPALAAQPHAGGVFRIRTDTRGRPAGVFPG